MRKDIIIEIEAEGRDQGKVFHIKEMPAFQAEWFAARLFIALARSGVTIPDNIAEMGIQGVAVLGMKALAGLNPDDAKPLLDEMLTCVSYMPDRSKPQMLRKLGLGGSEDIEEISTILRLRKEVFDLHVNFSSAAAR